MNSSFPERPKQHIIDTKGTNLLRSSLPNEFLFRTLGERDYGIDGLIEFAPGNQVLGIFISAQLKSTECVEWAKNGTTKISISTKTCNYWMNNIMPIFLFLADLSSNKVYYTDIKKQIRERYGEYKSKESFSFEISNRNDLYALPWQTSQISEDSLGMYVRFLASAFRMMRRSLFEDTVKDFVLNWKKYFEHIKHQGADPFLVQPLDFYMQTQHIHNCMIHISNELNLGMKAIDFQQIRDSLEELYDNWGTVCDDEVLEYEITVLHSKLEEYVEPIIAGLKKLILNSEQDFWRINFPIIYQEAQNIDWSYSEW